MSRRAKKSAADNSAAPISSYATGTTGRVGGVNILFYSLSTNALRLSINNPTSLTHLNRVAVLTPLLSQAWLYCRNEPGLCALDKSRSETTPKSRQGLTELTDIGFTPPHARISALTEDGWSSADVGGFIELVGPILMRSEGQRMRFGFLAQPKHENLRGVVQGGMVATFCDRALGMAAMKTQNSAAMATIELDIRYIDAIRVGDFVEIVPEVLRATRSLVFMRGTVMVDTRIVATVEGIWKVLRVR